MTSDSNSADQGPTISVEELRKTFSKTAVDHMLKPRNLGELAGADGVGRASIACGDSIQICLRVGNDRIVEARFMTDGCGPVIACGSAATELARGKTVAAATALNEDDVAAALDGLPVSETHCATLAVTALKEALRDYLVVRREPWKKTYRQVDPFTPGK